MKSQATLHRTYLQRKVRLVDQSLRLPTCSACIGYEAANKGQSCETTTAGRLPWQARLGEHKVMKPKRPCNGPTSSTGETG